MPVPAGLQGVTVSVGPLYDAGSAPAASIPFKATLDAKVRITDSGVLLPSYVQTATDANGEATILLVASDSTGLDTTGFTYRLKVPGVTTGDGVDVLLPAATPSVRLEDLSPIEQTPGVIIWVPSEITDAQIDAIVGDGGSATRLTLDGLYAALGDAGAVDSVDGKVGVVTLGDLYDPLGSAAAAQGAAESTAAGYVITHEAGSGVHGIAGTTGLQAALDGKETSGAAASAVSSHEGGSGVHTIAGTTGLQGALDGKETSGAAATVQSNLDVHAAGRGTYYDVDYDTVNSRWPAVPSGGNPSPPDGSTYYRMNSIKTPGAGVPDEQSAVNDWTFLAGVYYVWEPGTGVNPV